MRKKYLFRTIAISLIAMLIFASASTILMFFSTEKLLKNDLKRISDIVKDEAIRGATSYQNLVAYENTSDVAFRITFIDNNGKVLADSIQIDTSENHLEREEVKSAINGIPKFSKRYSKTLDKKMLYYAVPFHFQNEESVTVLRVAVEMSSTTNVIVSSIIILISVAFVLVIALSITHSKYNNLAMLPIHDLKKQLNSISLGQFEKLSVDKNQKELLPIITELNDIAEHINELNKVRSDFFANASHELNTPLTYIKGYAELMEQGILTDANKIKECGNVIARQTSNMQVLINDMLALSALENSNLDIQMDNFLLENLLNSIIADFKPQIDDKKITIKSYCFIKSLFSSEKLIKEILTNLISNAIKYNNSGGKIDIFIKEQQSVMQIIVSDNGIGIPRQEQKRIFERFYRVDKARSKQTGGTGLGLAIVKHSAQKLGGFVIVESEANKFTKFTVTLPLIK